MLDSGQNESNRKEIEILKALSGHDKPLGSTMLSRELRRRGFLLSERAIRYHLQLLQARGLIHGHDRSGRTITQEGLKELGRALAYERVGFVTTRFLSLAYTVTYEPRSDKGKVVANVSFVDKALHDRVLKVLDSLHEKDLLLAPYIKVLDEGEEHGEISVPKGQIAIFTVCNLTIDGVLMHSGIPIIPTYGGLVQFLKYKPIRFVELISYNGTTIPPLEVFVYRGMTSIDSVLKTGSGMLTAGLRELPMTAGDATQRVISNLKDKGWGGILAFGKPNEAILGIPVSMDRVGISMVGGLIPAVIMKERGAKIETFAPHCLISVKELKKI